MAVPSMTTATRHVALWVRPERWYTLQSAASFSTGGQEDQFV